MKEGWYEDPSDRHEYRWFSQGTPTDLVRDGTITSRDPISVTDPAAFESMELKRPPDTAPLLQSGPALPPDAYQVGAAYGFLDPPPQDVQQLAQRLARRPRMSELLVVLLPVPIGLALIQLNLRLGGIVLLATPVLGFIWLPWRMTRPKRMAHVEGKWGSWALAGVGAVFVGSLVWGYYWLSGGAPSGPASSLFAAHSNIVFVQWHHPTSSGAITGTITYANLAGKPPTETVATESDPFTGQLSPGGAGTNGPSLSLTVSGQSFASGTLQNGKLALYIPNEVGFGGSTYVLVRSDSAAYNAALKVLTAQKQRTNKRAVAHR